MVDFCIHTELANAIAERQLQKIQDGIDDIRVCVHRLYRGRDQADINEATVEAYAKQLEYLADILRQTKRAPIIHLEAAE